MTAKRARHLVARATTPEQRVAFDAANSDALPTKADHNLVEAVKATLDRRAGLVGEVMSKPVKRGHLEILPPADRGWMDPDGELECTSGEQGVTIAVTDDKALDSYNQTFTCEAVLSRGDAELLRDWLIEVLS